MSRASLDGILEERAKSYGHPSVNLTRIAGLWSAYLGTEVTAHDVAWLMALLKASRSKADPVNADNYLDGKGYIDLAEMLQ